MNIAIIGGGPGGLIALYECKRRYLKATLYEKQKDGKGVWNLKSSQSRAHYSTMFNSSYFLSLFDLDFTTRKNLESFEKDFLTSSEYSHYLDNLISSNNLKNSIQYNHEVKDIITESNSFIVNVFDKELKRDVCYHHDYVIICTGRCGFETIPTEPIISKDVKVDNEYVFHSSDWDPLNPESSSSKINLKEKCRILVIGAGHSGAESIQDALEAASKEDISSCLQIFWAPTRRPDKRNVWMFDRYPYDGAKAKLPLDESPCRLYKYIPSWIVSRAIRNISIPIILANKNDLPHFGRDIICICKTNLLKNAMQNGTVQILNKAVLRVYKDSTGNILFDTCDDKGVIIDYVVLATGYRYADIKINGEYILRSSKFHRNIIPLDENLFGRLGFVGTSRIVGTILNVLQMEIRWLLYQWFDKNSHWKSTLASLQSTKNRDNLKGTLTDVPMQPVMILDELAKDIGAMPRTWSDLLSSSRRRRHVALACMLSPMSIHQYKNPTENDQEKEARENQLIQNTKNCFKRANKNFTLICYLADLLFYFVAFLIVFQLFRFIRM